MKKVAAPIASDPCLANGFALYTLRLTVFSVNSTLAVVDYVTWKVREAGPTLEASCAKSDLTPPLSGRREAGGMEAVYEGTEISIGGRSSAQTARA
jgi:hypothetical protein